MGNPILDTFFEETEELLESLAEGLESMQGAEFDKEIVNSVFRAVHSIKGGAGAFKLNALVSFAHSFETVLDEVRSETLELTPQVMHTLIRSADHLTDLVDAALAEDRDPVRQAQRLFLIVGHIEDRDPGFLMDAADFKLDLLAQLLVQGRQGFIHQQHRRIVNQGAGKRDALLLPA